MKDEDFIRRMYQDAVRDTAVCETGEKKYHDDVVFAHQYRAEVLGRILDLPYGQYMVDINAEITRLEKGIIKS